MRRLLVIVLILALVASTALAVSLHVHAYAEHDHPEHHHSPASHEHHQAAVADDDDHHAETGDHGLPAFQADSCDPGHHSVDVTMGCAQVPQLHLAIAELPSPTVVVPAAPVQSVAPVKDVRVHGPPFDSRIPARAPPSLPSSDHLIGTLPACALSLRPGKPIVRQFE